jgi:hypothetical protein
LIFVYFSFYFSCFIFVTCCAYADVLDVDNDVNATSTNVSVVDDTERGDVHMVHHDAKGAISYYFCYDLCR